MQPRIPNPVMTVPGAMKAILALAKSVHGHLPDATLNLVQLRASQINGCGVCTEMHSLDMRTTGEPDERIFAVAAWRDAPYFTSAERAALALTEAETRLADHPDAVTDEIWAEAARHYSEDELAALVLAIAAINVWNRVNATTRQPTDSYRAAMAAPQPA
jgi:AhpD family alkylhydroperoxidase